MKYLRCFDDELSSSELDELFMIAISTAGSFAAKRFRAEDGYFKPERELAGCLGTELGMLPFAGGAVIRGGLTSSHGESLRVASRHA